MGDTKKTKATLKKKKRQCSDAVTDAVSFA